MTMESNLVQTTPDVIAKAKTYFEELDRQVIESEPPQQEAAKVAPSCF